MGIVDDPPQVALEVAVIDRVEANERGEQPPVRLRDVLADEVALAREPPLELVERTEHRAERLFVGFLRDGETCPIDAVVDVLVNERVDAVDLFAQRRRGIVGERLGEDAENYLEHPDYRRR